MLAILAPIAMSWNSSSNADEEDWDASEFVIRSSEEERAVKSHNTPAQAKPPVMLNQQQQQRRPQQSGGHPTAAIQMTRQQQKHAIVAAAMHNVTGTGYGGASVLLNTVKDPEPEEKDTDKDLMFAGDPFSTRHAQ